MRYGYVRGTENESMKRQQNAIESKQVDAIYGDKQVGDKEALGFKGLVQKLKAGDTVIVESLACMCRSTADLQKTAEKFEKIGVRLISIDEELDSETETGKMFIRMLARAAARHQVHLKMSQTRGIKQAKAMGKFRGKKKIEVDEILFKKVYEMWKSGEIIAKKAMKMLKLTSATFYRRVAEYEKTKKADEEEFVDF